MRKTNTVTFTKDISLRVVVSTTAFHARVRGSVPGLGDLKETKTVSPPSTRNPVSGGQFHLIHLTIFSRFSWPSSAYMCTKVA